MKGSLHILHVDRAPERQDYDRRVTLAELKAGIGGGYLEAVPGFGVYEGQCCVAFCDEDGKGKNLPLNVPATIHWAAALGTAPGNIGDHLVGDVVIVTGDDEFMDEL